MTWTSNDLAGLRVIGDTSKPATRPRPATGRATPAPAPMVGFGGIVDSEGSQTPATARESIYLPVTPYGKPRMTQRDKWMRRPCVIRYRQFCDAVRASWPAGVPYPAEGAHITFYLPMPKSWSRAKRDAHRGQAHQGKPDVDNLLKAVLDALHTDDAFVSDVRITKRWAEAGYISITLNDGRDDEKPNTFLCRIGGACGLAD